MLKVRGVPAVSYVSDQTPMMVYINTHVAVDQIRHRNQLTDKIGVKVFALHRLSISNFIAGLMNNKEQLQRCSKLSIAMQCADQAKITTLEVFSECY